MKLDLRFSRITCERTISYYKSGGDDALASLYKNHWLFEDLGLGALKVAHYGGKNQEINVMGEMLYQREDLFRTKGLLTHVTTNLVRKGVDVKGQPINDILTMYGEHLDSRIKGAYNFILFKSPTDKRDGVTMRRRRIEELTPKKAVAVPTASITPLQECNPIYERFCALIDRTKIEVEKKVERQKKIFEKQKEAFNQKVEESKEAGEDFKGTYKPPPVDWERNFRKNLWWDAVKEFAFPVERTARLLFDHSNAAIGKGWIDVNKRTMEAKMLVLSKRRSWSAKRILIEGMGDVETRQKAEQQEKEAQGVLVGEKQPRKLDLIFRKDERSKRIMEIDRDLGQHLDKDVERLLHRKVIYDLFFMLHKKGFKNILKLEI